VNWLCRTRKDSSPEHVKHEIEDYYGLEVQKGVSGL